MRIKRPIKRPQSFCRGSEDKPGCGQPIEWGRTSCNRWMPLDSGVLWVMPAKPAATKLDDAPAYEWERAEEIPRAERVVILTSAGAVVTGRAAKPWQDGAVSGRRPHWSNCPRADDFRRRQVDPPDATPIEKHPGFKAKTKKPDQGSLFPPVAEAAGDNA